MNASPSTNESGSGSLSGLALILGFAMSTILERERKDCFAARAPARSGELGEQALDDDPELGLVHRGQVGRDLLAGPGDDRLLDVGPLLANPALQHVADA